MVLRAAYHSCLRLTAAADPTVATVVNTVCFQLKVWESASPWVTAFLRCHHSAHLRGQGWWEFPRPPQTSPALAPQFSAECLRFPHPAHARRAPGWTASITAGPREPHSVKLHAYIVFFHVPKIKCVFCSALGGALEAILRPPPKIVPSCVPTLNSALFLYSISKASYCYLANWIIKLSIFEFKKTYYNPSKQKGFFHGNYLSSTLSWLEFT